MGLGFPVGDAAVDGHVGVVERLPEDGNVYFWSPFYNGIIARQN